jgi:hypothetical protein
MSFFKLMLDQNGLRLSPEILEPPTRSKYVINDNGFKPAGQLLTF